MITVLALPVAVAVSIFIQYLVNHPLDYTVAINQMVNASGETIELPLKEFPVSAGPSPISLHIEVPPLAESDLALFAPGLSGKVRLWIGGELMFDNFSATDTGDINSLDFIYVDWPENTDSTATELKIEFDGPDSKPIFFSPIYIGERDTLHRKAVTLDFMRVHVPEASFGVCATLLFFLIYLMVIGALGNEAIMPLVMILVLMPFLAIRCYSYEIALLHDIFPYVFPFSLAAIVPSFALMFGLQKSPWNGGKQKFLLINLAVVAMTYLATAMPDVTIHSVNLNFVAPALFLSTLFTFLFSWLMFMRHGQWSFFLQAFSFGSLAFSVLFDLLVWSGWVNTVPVSGFALNYLAFSQVLILAHHHGASVLRVRNNELSNLRLLAEQRKQIEASFQKSIESERRAIQAEEKEKLAANLHDGVLSYLTYVSALTKQADPGLLPQIGSLVGLAMIEMRTVVRFVADRRTSSDISVLAFLAVFRDETQKALSVVGIEISWHLLDLSRISATSFDANLSLMRILQEAVHNATYRAQARYISVTAVLNDNDWLTLEILNSGGAPFCSTTPKGHGIHNMEQRALKLDGTFEIEPRPDGALARVRLPLGTHFVRSG
ncbi:Signal transduction histidine kinase [Roseovarius litoreus]|uniref:histidine kinase n=1 Tax=Roseovarius litoreus TaxID=1155722 RepID=A0A1M7E767_9RHOB|nr:hypothetical protein [Roseovarius litoreus]SHL87567.1 Signal transduction histidine kinase [Roseovarius litoreus]